MYALQHTTGWYYVFNTDMQELQILWWTVSKEKENCNPEKMGYSWHMIVKMWQHVIMIKYVSSEQQKC